MDEPKALPNSLQSQPDAKLENASTEAKTVKQSGSHNTQIVGDGNITASNGGIAVGGNFIFQEPPIPLPSSFQQPDQNELRNFVGHEESINELARLLKADDIYHVGIVGMGGSGKTWLAIKVANKLTEYFTDGILWADLESNDPSSNDEKIAESERHKADEELVNFAAPFGMKEEIAQLPELHNKSKKIRELIKYKKLLVVIDGVSTHPAVEALLSPRGTPNDGSIKSRTLIITRNRDILADSGAEVYEMPIWETDEALEFLEKLLGKKLLSSEKSLAENIISVVNNLPLAIRIIGSNLRRSSQPKLNQYLTSLQNETTRLKQLQDRRNLGYEMDKNLSVEASFNLSYKLLPLELQKLFACLGVFRGSDFDVDSVAIVTCRNSDDVRQDLDMLCSCSLIEYGLGVREKNYINTDKQAEYQDSERYRLHPILKSLAWKKLDESDELVLDQLNARLLAYYTNLIQTESSSAIYTKLELEWPNILGSLEWAYEHERISDLLVCTLGLTAYNPNGHMGFLDNLGYWSDARKLLGWVYEHNDTINNSLDEASIITNMAGFAIKQSDHLSAQKLLQEARDLIVPQKKNLPRWLVKTWRRNFLGKNVNQTNLSDEYLHQQLIIDGFMAQSYRYDDKDKALSHIQRGLDESTGMDSPEIKVQQGHLYILQASILNEIDNNTEAAEDAALRGLSLLPDVPSSVKAEGLMILGLIAQRKVLTNASRQYFSDAVEIASTIRDWHKLARIWGNQSTNERRDGNLTEAILLLKKAEEAFRVMGNTLHEYSAKINLGHTYIRMHQEAQTEGAPPNAIDAKKVAESYLLNVIDTEKRFNGVEKLKAFANSTIADLYLQTNELEQAIRHVASAAQMADEQKLVHLIPTIIRQQAQIALQQDNFEDGLHLIDKAIAPANKEQDAEEEGISWHVKGLILIQLERIDEAKVALTQSLHLLKNREYYEYTKTERTMAELNAEK